MGAIGALSVIPVVFKATQDTRESTARRPEVIMRVLLFDRNPKDVLCIKGLLACAEDVEFEVVYAVDSSEAVEHLAHAPFDVILMDLDLSHGDGLLELRRILVCAGRAPVLILTSIANEPAAAMALEAGAGDYLFKGELDPTMLAGAICFLSSQPRPMPPAPSPRA